MSAKIKKMLEEQVRLLYEQTKKTNSVKEMRILTKAMCEVARQLQSQSCGVQGYLASVQLSAKELADVCAGQYERVSRQLKISRKK